MLDKTYKSYFDKIEPTDELIRRTKAKMIQEKTKKHFSFYKYGGLVAACLIIVVFTALIRTQYDSIQSETTRSITINESLNSDTLYTKPSTKTDIQSDGNLPTPSSFFNESNSGIMSSMDSQSDIASAAATKEPLWKTILFFPIRLIKALIENIF